MARTWSQRLLAIAADKGSPEPLRGAAVQVFGVLGPQCSGEELQLAALLRPAVGVASVAVANTENGAVDLDEATTSATAEGPAAAPASVRAGAVDIISKLAAAERIKNRQCLCRLSEALIDSSPLVREAAVVALQATLNEVGCAYSKVLPTTCCSRPLDLQAHS
jgi:hypothetical protein